MNEVISLAWILDPTRASHDCKSLTECVVLQASPGVIGCIERLVLAGWKEVGGGDTIDCTLEDWMEVFFEVGMGDPCRRCGRDSGGRRAVGGDGEAYKVGGRCVYSGIHGGIHGCGRCGGGWLLWGEWILEYDQFLSGLPSYLNFGGATIQI